MKEILENLASEIGLNLASSFVSGGYDPITDLIDHYEKVGTEDPSDWYADEELIAENIARRKLLSELSILTEQDLNYKSIYIIFYYGNAYYYSKEQDDIFSKEWSRWSGDNLFGGKSLAWYYHFLSRRISMMLDDENSRFLSGEYEQTPAGYVPYIDEELDDLKY